MQYKGSLHLMLLQYSKLLLQLNIQIIGLNIKATVVKFHFKFVTKYFILEKTISTVFWCL